MWNKFWEWRYNNPWGLLPNIALDTCTGQLCRTWDWQLIDPKGPGSGYQDLPLCSSLPNER